MSKHTPGPWVVVTELRDTDEIICDMLNNGYVAITQGQKLANWRDDAALIAAAPDLLEALEESFECASILRNLIENIEAHGNYSAESTINFLNQSLFCHRLSEKAIAKARGEQ